LKNWLQEAGITKHITYHCSRHTLGSLQVEAGTSVYTVQHILGHKEEPVPEKTAEESHASEPTSPALQPSVERDEKILAIISRSTEENDERRKKFIEMRKEIMKEYVYWVVSPLLDESDLLPFWLELEQWIESPSHHPKSRMWKWKVKVTNLDMRHLMLKMHYFQRKHKEKAIFPLIIRIFLLYLQRF